MEGLCVFCEVVKEISWKFIEICCSIFVTAVHIYNIYLIWENIGNKNTFLYTNHSFQQILFVSLIIKSLINIYSVLKNSRIKTFLVSFPISKWTVTWIFTLLDRQLYTFVMSPYILFRSGDITVVILYSPGYYSLK